MSLISCLLFTHFYCFPFLFLLPYLSLSLYVVLSVFFSLQFTLFPLCLTHLVIWPANRLNRFDCATMQSCTLPDQASNNRFMWFAHFGLNQKKKKKSVLVETEKQMTSSCRCCQYLAVGALRVTVVVTPASSAFVPFLLKMDLLLLIGSLLRRERCSAADGQHSRHLSLLSSLRADLFYFKLWQRVTFWGMQRFHIALGFFYAMQRYALKAFQCHIFEHFQGNS